MSGLCGKELKVTQSKEKKCSTSKATSFTCILGLVVYLCCFVIFYWKGFFGCNSLPDDKILDWSKFKQIADDISKCI